jgi:hypothetical protein
MQIKKEIFSICILILICLSLVVAAGFDKTPASNCPIQAPSVKECCKKEQDNSKISPWNFITQGIFHFSS